MPQCDNPFWRFSLAVYAAPGVASECLALQDGQGIDVNVLLFCAWLGAIKRFVVLPADIEEFRGEVQQWRDTVITPLRAVRRDVKAIPDSTENDVSTFRQDLAALELRAEQIEQAILYRIAASYRSSGLSPAELTVWSNIALLVGEDAASNAPQLIAAAVAYHASDEDNPT